MSCNLYIDGYFEGNINSEQEINIGKNGKIKGEITALRVIVQGLAEGSIPEESAWKGCMTSFPEEEAEEPAPAD